MSNKSKAFTAISKPWIVIYYLGKTFLKRLIPTKMYIKCQYRTITGLKLNLRHPKSFNEKLQWLKLFDRNPKYINMVDKVLAKEYVATVIGSEYIVPTLKVWKNSNEIDLEGMPEQFVLKCSHDSSSVIVCKDKKALNIQKTKSILRNCMKKNFYYYGREWPYKGVKKKIFAEEYLSDSSGGLVDYKFYCFNGYVDCVMVCIDRHLSDTKFYFFDSDWNLKRINKRGRDAPSNFSLPKPKGLEEMFHIASVLSKGIPFVRVDLYNCFGRIYFSELTFYPDSGYDVNYLKETNDYFGELIDLRLAFKYTEKE